MKMIGIAIPERPITESENFEMLLDDIASMVTSEVLAKQRFEQLVSLGLGDRDYESALDAISTEHVKAEQKVLARLKTLFGNGTLDRAGTFLSGEVDRT